MGHLERKKEWPRLLHKAIEKKQDAPFEYGVHDCCLSACDCVEAMTGVDIASPKYRGKYRSEAGAIAILGRMGGIVNLADDIAQDVSAPRVHNFAKLRRGDVVVVDGSDSWQSNFVSAEMFLGIVGLDGRSVYVPSREGGWAVMSRNSVVAGWEIG